jgi:hypothetical protein
MFALISLTQVINKACHCVEASGIACKQAQHRLQERKDIRTCSAVQWIGISCLAFQCLKEAPRIRTVISEQEGKKL